MKYVLFVDGWPTLTSKNYVVLVDLRMRSIKRDTSQTILILNERMAYYM